MSKRHRNRHARPNSPPVSATMTEPSASWDHRTGYSSGAYRVLDGSKFRGALLYPAATDLDYTALRLRSQLASWESAQAQAILRRLVDNTIGTGLTLQPEPIWSIINHPRYKDRKAQDDYTRAIGLRFHLWFSSPEFSADRSRNGYESQAFQFINALRSGESCHILRYSPERNRISPLSVQNIDVDQLVTPYGKQYDTDTSIRGTRIKDGIEVNAAGEMVAIHIQDPEAPAKFTRVTTYGGGGAGRRWVLHPIISDLVGAVRGTPILAPLVHELQKLVDYEVAELECAINNAVILGFVTTDVDGQAKSPIPMGGARLRSGSAPESTTPSDTEPKRATIHEAGLYLQNLGKGQDLKAFDTKHPNAGFEPFVKAVTKIISAALSIPVEVLEMSFNANYSASRASLILFWKTVTRWRSWHVAQYLRPIYEAWFAEEVRAGRIDAPGFDDPLVRAAWLDASWVGESLPSIDPQKDAQADDLRIAQGATTREQVALKYNGSDYRTNVARLKEENTMLTDAGGAAQEAQRAAAAPPVPDDTPDPKEANQ